MNTIIINGRSISVKGRNISISGDKVTVDGVVVMTELSGIIEVSFIGELASLESHNTTVTGNITGPVKSHNLTCRDIKGDVISHNVQSSSITGNVNAKNVSR